MPTWLADLWQKVAPPLEAAEYFSPDRRRLDADPRRLPYEAGCDLQAGDVAPSGTTVTEIASLERSDLHASLAPLGSDRRRLHRLLRRYVTVKSASEGVMSFFSIK